MKTDKMINYAIILLLLVNKDFFFATFYIRGKKSLVIFHFLACSENVLPRKLVTKFIK